MRYEIFSSRLRKQQEGISDVYIYDKVPEKLRIQVIHIWHEAIGARNTEVWRRIDKVLSKELGLFSLVDEEYSLDLREGCENFLISCDDIHALDIIELSFFILSQFYLIYEPVSYRFNHEIDESFEDAINELNYRFKDNGVGYEFINNALIRIDQTHMHQEVIKPAISLLLEEGFEGAMEEFLNAHRYYRTGNYKSALVEALKSFESTMKTICDKKGYVYNRDSDAAQRLITVLLENNLIPQYLQTHFSGLRSTLGAGLPTVRNRQAGHGQGSESLIVEPYFVEYALNLAATNIVLLVKAYKGLIHISKLK